MSIIIAILVFGAIIAIHEAGHFAAAKLSGVRVNEFALGMGPAIIKFKKGETTYALRLLPIGGFCSMEGEDESSEDERAFGNKPVWKRIIIVAAGAVMNLILGFILLICMVSSDDAITSTTIHSFTPRSEVLGQEITDGVDEAMSHQTGLEVGDKIVEINGMHIFTATDISYQFQNDEDGVFEMVVERGGQKVKLPEVTFDKPENTLYIDFIVVGERITAPSVMKEACGQFATYSRLIWISFGDLVTGKYKLNDLSGPVGIVDVIGDVVDSQRDEETNKIDWSALWGQVLNIAAFITINVGIFNLIPFPALDGGRLVFLIIEAIRRKKIPPEKEGMVHLIGLGLLMLLMVVITFNDIIKLF